FQKIHESDMLLMPDPTTPIVDPGMKIPTLSIVCAVRHAVTGELCLRDPRGNDKKAQPYLKSTGIASTSYWGPEAEFFLFNDVRFEQSTHTGSYFIDSDEGIWNSGQSAEKPNLAYRPRHKEGYFPVPP